MTSILHESYPGDRCVELVLIVAVGIAVLSSAAWLIARRLARQPASRHLVLVAALLGCLAMPGLATALQAVGLTLVAIPILPGQHEETQLPNAARPGRSVRLTAPPVLTPIRPESRLEPAPIAAGAAKQAGTQEPASLIPPAPRPVSFRESASVGLLLWACGSVFLGLRMAWGCGSFDDSGASPSDR